METIVLALETETLRRIEAEARREGLTPETLVRRRVEEAFGGVRPDSAIEDVADYVTRKNAEL